MKRIRYFTSILLLFSLFTLPAVSQAPAGGISYQAVALDRDGSRIADTDIQVRFSLLGSSGQAGDPLYQEVHTAHTGSDGLFTLVIGMGDVTAASVYESLSEIDYGSRSLYLRVETDRDGQGEFTLMGIQQMMSVPFAMHAGVTDRYFMQAASAHDPEEAVFAVRNSAGDTVFAVYESGVQITVDDDPGKGSRGGFAVGGFSAQKGDGHQYLRVDPGDVRITIDDTPDDKGSRGGFAIGGFSHGKQDGGYDYFSLTPAGTLVQFDPDYDAGLKGSRGGFAVGGFSQQKSALTDYLFAGPDSVRIYIDDTPDGKGSRGGFAVGGFSQQKSGEEAGFLHMGSGSFRIGIDDTPDLKGSRGGFAVGGFSQQKSGGSDYLLLDAGSALFTLDSDMSKGSRGGFAVGGFSEQKDGGVTGYLSLTADSARVTVEDNLLTKGKGSRGGFAVGGFSQQKGGPFDILYTSPEKTNIYISQEGKFLPGGFSIFSFDDIFAPKDLFQVTRDTTRVAGVFAVVPGVTTAPVTGITTTTASGGGEVVYDGEAEVTGRGLVWSRNSRPRVSDNEGISEEGDGLGAFTSALTGLQPGFRYYVRAYATNVAGNGYGEQVEFFTDNIITATAGEGGSIDPEGEVILARGATQVYTISPGSGYEIDDVTLGGTSVLGSVSIDAGTGIGTYTFTNNVTGTRTLQATFKEMPYPQTTQNYFENFNVNNDQGFSYLAEDGYSYTFNGEYNFSSGMDYFAHILLPLEATKDDFSFRLIPGSMYAGVQTTGFGRMGFRSFIGVMVNHISQTVDVVYTEDMNYTESNLIPIKQVEFFEEIMYAQLNVTRVEGNNMHVSLLLNGMLVCNETVEGVDEGLFSGQMLLYLEKEEMAEFMEASFAEFEVNYNPWIDTPGSFTDDFTLVNPPWFRSGNFDVLSTGIFVEGGQMKFVDAGTGDYKELTVVAPVGPVRDFNITVEAGVEAAHTSELGIARFFDGMDEYVMLLYDGQTLSLVYDDGAGFYNLISDSTLTESGLVTKIEFSVIEVEADLSLFVNINDDPEAVVYGTIFEAPQRIKSGHLAISFFGEQVDFIDAYIDNVTISYVPFTGEGFGDLFGGGSGTMMDPFIIDTDEHLFNVRYAPNAHFRQGFNIYLAESVYTSGVGGWMPIGNSMQPFTGTYDGNGMVIQDLYSGRSEENEIGLFGYTFDAHIHDLGLEWVSMAGNQGVGGLVGISVNSLIERVSVTGMIEGNDWAGGIAGRSRDNSLIKDSWADAGVMGGNLYAGGLVGFNDFGAIISGCYSIGSVSGNEAVGGLVGWLGGGSGVNNSYSAASVNGSYEAGGFVGHNDGTITNCYSIGFVESGGNFIGGFSGRNETGLIVDSYWNTGTSGQETSFGGEGRATEQLNMQTAFPPGWDFVTIWQIEDVITYPFLQWQGGAGEHNLTGLGL